MKILKVFLTLFVAVILISCNKDTANIVDSSDELTNSNGKSGLIQTGTTLLVPSQYSTIQDAVDAASDGDIIKVSSGTYAEQVEIRDLDNLQLIGDDATITVPTGGMKGTLLKIYNCQDIHIKGFTIDGNEGVGVSYGASNSGGDADTRFYGLFAINSSGKFEKNIIKDISWHNGVQQGIGMYVYVTDGTERKVSIFENEILNYNKGGLSVRGPIISKINKNTITHWNETGITAGNGLQVDGGSAQITNNTISGCRYYDETHDQWSSAAILLISWVCEAESFNVTNNNISNSDVGIDIFDFFAYYDLGVGLGEIKVTNNKFSGNIWDGPFIGPDEDYPAKVHANKY